MQDKNILLNFSKNLRNLRNSKNYTQQYVAEKLEVDRAVYARWESKNPPNIKLLTLVKLLDFYQIEFEKLIS